MSKIVMGTLFLFALVVLAISLLVTNRRQSGYINQLSPPIVTTTNTPGN